MSEQKTERAPFYLAIRPEGHLINAWMCPSAEVAQMAIAQGEHWMREPVLMGSISRSVCDTTGGQEGPIYKRFLALMKDSVRVSCEAALGCTVVGFEHKEGPDPTPIGNA
jgi:hypothetical protein